MSLSDYEGLAGESQQADFRELTALEAVALYDSGASFALFCGYADCFYCNQMIALLNAAALQADMPVAYVNTRADASWTSNTDIEGYDQFMDRFGEWAGKDDDGNPHLYVPYVLFAKDGELVSARSGLLDEGTNEDNPLTSEQRARLQDIYLDGFELLAASSA